jgi:hypothetical protein
VTTEALRFPLTLWPGTAVPVPAVSRFADVKLDVGGYLLFQDPVEQVELPPELCLRELFELDTASNDDVLQFLRCYGVLGRRFVGLLPVGGAPAQPPEFRMAPHATNHVRDAALFLKTARALTRHWIAVDEGTEIREAWAAEMWGDEGYKLRIGTAGALWDWFVRSMNEGLRAFTVRVEYPITTTSDVRFTLGLPRPDLYSALCLQLANHIAEGLSVRRCQNETCNRRFVRQHDGARHKQNRTIGVMYCSKSCANSQWQREHRRRTRQRKQS